MVETEMSIQSEAVLSNTTSSYSKIETKEEDCYIDPKDIRLGIYSKDLNENNNHIINSDQLLPISIEQTHEFCFKRIVKTYAFFGDIHGDPKIIIGPHWPLYIVVVAFFFFGIKFIYSRFGQFINIYLKIIGIILYLIFFISYTYTVLINPGYPKHDIDALTGEPRKKFYYCERCQLWASKEKRTMHCKDCDICVEGNDHHCPWTGKCIGKKNFTSFIIFVVSIFVMFIYFFFLVGLNGKAINEVLKKK